jgi:hypothetical protein
MAFLCQTSAKPSGGFPAFIRMVDAAKLRRLRPRRAESGDGTFHSASVITGNQLMSGERRG